VQRGTCQRRVRVCGVGKHGPMLAEAHAECHGDEQVRRKYNAATMSDSKSQ